MLNIVKDKPQDHVSVTKLTFYKIKYMLDYLEKNFGERALNGDA